MEPKLGGGFYTFAEAARLTQLKAQRVREWFLGRAADKGSEAVFHGDYQPVDGGYSLSFHDLIDAYVAGNLREHGVSLQTLRKVRARMGQDLKTPHPFSRKELLSDGREVFMRGVDSEGKEELTEVLTRQKVFPQIILPFLKAIDYDQITILAQRWRIAKGVVIDPAICFGRPVIEEVSIPTYILATAYAANDRDAELVGSWYDVHPSQVLAAVEFEASLAA